MKYEIHWNRTWDSTEKTRDEYVSKLRLPHRSVCWPWPWTLHETWGTRRSYASGPQVPQWSNERIWIWMDRQNLDCVLCRDWNIMKYHSTYSTQNIASVWVKNWDLIKLHLEASHWTPIRCIQQTVFLLPGQPQKILKKMYGLPKIDTTTCPFPIPITKSNSATRKTNT